MLKNRKAAGLIEYAIIIGTISLALTTMSVYIKRGIQGKIKDITYNSIADATLVRNFLGDGLGEDRFRDRVSSDFTTTTSATTTLNVQGGTSTINLSENIQRSGNERIVEPLSFWNNPKRTVPGSRGRPRKPLYPDREEQQGEIDSEISNWQGGIGRELQEPPPGGPEQPEALIEETPPIIEEWQTPVGDGVAAI